MDAEIYQEARRRVKEKAKFYKHLTSYLIFNGVFLTMAMFRDGNLKGPLMVAFFWGIGLAFNYIKVFGLPGSGILSKEWEDKELEKEVNKMKRSDRTEEHQAGLELKELRKNYDESELV